MELRRIDFQVQTTVEFNETFGDNFSPPSYHTSQATQI